MPSGGAASAAGFARRARRRSGSATSSAPATRRRRWRRGSPAACRSSTIHHGMLVAAMRWSTSDSIVGASASQPPMPDDRADDRGDGAGERAAGEHRQADVALAAADRRQHAVLGNPPLGDHGEAGGGDQRDEQQHDGAGEQHEHAGEHVLGDLAAARRVGSRRRSRRRSGGVGLRRRSISIATDSELAISDGGTSTNSSLRLFGFSTMPTTWRGVPSMSIVSPIVEPTASRRRHR